MLKQAWNNNKGTIVGAVGTVSWHRSSPTTGVAAPFLIAYWLFPCWLWAHCGHISWVFNRSPLIQTLPWTFLDQFLIKLLTVFKKIRHSMPNRAHLWADLNNWWSPVCTLSFSYEFLVCISSLFIITPCPAGTYWIPPSDQTHTLRNITTLGCPPLCQALRCSTLQGLTDF